MNNCIHLLSDTNYSQKEIINLLSNLSECVIIEDNEWVRFIKNIPDNQKIFCYTLENRLVGMITVIIEKKIIHGYKCVGHIEDLVVDPKYRNKNIGGQLLDYVYNHCKKENCYKIILNCISELEKFYIKNNYKYKCIQMRRDII
jgi:glucosamine-phosphate N-acetyltransferase